MQDIDTTDRQAILGTLIHTPVRGEVEIIDQGILIYDDSGVIERVIDVSDSDHGPTREAFARTGRLQTLGPTRYLLPGLVDLHVHAPQWPQLGKALHLPLSEWLADVTFPLEARYADTAFAEIVYRQLVTELLAQGTTTAMYFGTIHVDATTRLAEICADTGQRAYVGRVAMDDTAQCPDYYRDESAAAGLDATVDFLERVEALSRTTRGTRIHGVVTPRFIPSCSDRLLSGLGDLVAQRGCHVQTHCSESDWEHDYVWQRMGRSDTRSLADFGLLTNRTVLAHCGFIDDADMGLMVSRGSSVAHCPLSNISFANAVFPLRRALDSGVNVGLGTDISGGPSPSILDNCCHAVTASRMMEDGVNPSLSPKDRGLPGARVDFMEAFWLATVGGGKALGAPVGLLAPGYRLDAIIIDTDTADSDVHVFADADSHADIFQKIVYHARRRNIVEVRVDGRTVMQR